MTCFTTERARDKAFEHRRYQAWPSRKVMIKDVARALYKMGEAVTLAEYEGGTCILCGKHGGRCAGVHAVSEWQRVEAGIM